MVPKWASFLRGKAKVENNKVLSWNPPLPLYGEDEVNNEPLPWVLLKMVAAPSRHVFDEAICVNFMCIYICFKNVLGIG